MTHPPERITRTLFLLMTLLLAVAAMSQGMFTVNGRLKIEGGDLASARVVIYKNGSEVGRLTTELNKFSVDMDLHADYVLAFEKDGYVTKKLSFNTRVPADMAMAGFAPFQFSVSLFKQYSEVNTVVFNQPVGMIRYENALGDFDYDTDYTRSIQKQMQQTIAQVEQRQKEEAAQAAANGRREAAAARAEAERIAAEKKAEAERAVAARKAEEERIAAEKRAEAERAVAARKAEEERIAAEKRAEAERAAAARKAEEERVAAEQRAEEERIAAERKAEEERLAAVKQAELERVAAARKAEEERLVAEQQAEEVRLEEERRQAARRKADADRALAEQRAAEAERQRLQREHQAEARRKAEEQRRAALAAVPPAPQRVQAPVEPTAVVTRSPQRAGAGPAVPAKPVAGEEQQRYARAVQRQEDPPLDAGAMTGTPGTSSIGPITDRSEELIVEPNKVMTVVRIERDGHITEYRKVIHKWGGTFFFRNSESISGLVYEHEALQEEQLADAPRPKF